MNPTSLEDLENKNKYIVLSSNVRTNKEMLFNPCLVVKAVTQIWYSVYLCKLISWTSVTDIFTVTFRNTLGWTELQASS